MSIDSDNIIQAPVSAVEDVLSTFGITVSSTTGKLSYICGNTHGKINKWSRCKPVILASNAPSRSDDTWCKGTAGNYSLNFSKQTTLSGIVSAYNSGTNWDYLPPTGGSSAPYRLADFAKYNHYATKFVQSLTYPLSYTKGGSGITLEVNWRTDSTYTTGSISVTNLGFNTDYFGVVIVGNGVTRFILNATKIESNATSSVLIPDSVLTSNVTYKFYPVVSAQYLARYAGEGVTDSSGYTGLYTLPVSVGTVKVTTSVETSLAFSGATSVQFNRTTKKGYTATFTLAFIANSGYSITGLNAKLYQCATVDGTYAIVGSAVTLSPSSISGNGATKTQTYTGVTFTSTSILIDTEYVKLVVSGTVNNTTYTATIIKQMRTEEDIDPAEL